MKVYYSAKDIAAMLGVSDSKAYEIIRQLNLELEDEGYLVLRGKVPVAYFNKRWYGMEQMSQAM